MNTSRKQSFSVKQKMEILEKLKMGVQKRKDIAEEYKCDVSTLSRMVKAQHEIKSIALSNKNILSKKLKTGKHQNLDNAVLLWFQTMQSKNAIISGPVILEKAKQYAMQMNLECNISNGWLERWNNIVCKRLHGEKSSANTVSANEFMSTIGKEVVLKYESKNIFNADETDFFSKLYQH